MRRVTCLLVVLVAAALVVRAPARTRGIAERLGHPADAKLLIVHADDLAVAHAVDVASFDALERGGVSSASIMVPCPWLTEVADYAKAHPAADLGLHLTLTAEWQTYRWGSVAPSSAVPTLFDPAGTFWNDSALVGSHARVDEAEREIRAQIERARAVGLTPTHLDTHMGSLYATPALGAMFVRVAHEQHLPFMAVRGMEAAMGAPSPLTPDDVVLDRLIMADEKVPAAEWKTFYLNAIRSLTPGLTEIIVHLGRDDAELRAVTVNHEPFGAAWRQRDYDTVTGAAFRQALADNHVILVQWRDLLKLVAAG